MSNSEDLENEAGDIGAVPCLSLGETLNGLPPCLSCPAQHVLLSVILWLCLLFLLFSPVLIYLVTLRNP